MRVVAIFIILSFIHSSRQAECNYAFDMRNKMKTGYQLMYGVAECAKRNLCHQSGSCYHKQAPCDVSGGEPNACLDGAFCQILDEDGGYDCTCPVHVDGDCHALRRGSCHVTTGDRVSCQDLSVVASKETCIHRGCCWEEDSGAGASCYFPVPLTIPPVSLTVKVCGDCTPP